MPLYVDATAIPCGLSEIRTSPIHAPVAPARRSPSAAGSNGGAAFAASSSSRSSLNPPSGCSALFHRARVGAGSATASPSSSASPATRAAGR